MQLPPTQPSAILTTWSALAGQFLALAAALTAIIALRYFAVAAATHWTVFHAKGPRLPAAVPARRLGRRDPARAAMRQEARASLIAAPIYALPAAVALQAWLHGRGQLYLHLNEHPLWWAPAGFVAYLVLNDTYYYWLHRALHDRRLFRWTHLGHHRSREPTAYASFAFDWPEAVASAVFLPALTFVIPLQLGVAFLLLTVMTASAVLNHCGWEVWPRRWLTSPAGRWLITAAHHQQHHARLSCNYGLHLRVWDRIMGTDVEGEA